MPAPRLSEADRLARTRFIVLTAMRVGGVVVMLIGLAVWFKALLPNADTVGPLIFLVGMVEGIALPQILIRRWRTPPGR